MSTTADYDLEEIKLWYDRFLETVKQVAMSATEQIEKLHGTVVADEITSDFSDIGLLYAKKLLNCEWITPEQFSLVEDIDSKFEKMSQKKELWTDEALYISNEWEECRKMGKMLLEQLE